MSRRSFRAAAVLFAASLVASTAVAQGDDPTTAVGVNEGTFPFSTAGFSIPGNAPSCNQTAGAVAADGWWLYTATVTGNVIFTICPNSALPGGSANFADTYLNAWDVSLTTELACADGAPGCGVAESEFTLAVTAGNSYYVSVGSWFGSSAVSGSLAIGLPPPPPPNVFADDCSGATTVPEGVWGYDTTGFFINGGSATCTIAPTQGEDGWVAYVPSFTGFATVSNCGSSVTAPGGSTIVGTDTFIAIWDGSTCPPTTQITCADGSPQCGVGPSEATFPVLAGNTYYVQVGNWGSNLAVTGSVSIVVNVPPPPAGPGDDCSVAVAAAVPGVTPYSSAGFVAPGPQASCSAIGGPDPTDFWMSFTASITGLAVASNCPSSSTAPGGSASPTDTYLAAWDGATCPPTAQLACADGSPQCGVAQSEITFPIVAGNTYYVQVGTWGSATANTGGVSIVEILPPANDECTGAIPLAYGLNTGLNNVGATNSPQMASCGFMGADVWYTFVPTCSGNLVVETCGSGLDTEIAVWDGCPGTGVQVGCNGDAGGTGPCQFTLQSFVSVPVLAGNTYYIEVGGWNAQTGGFQLNVHCTYIHQWSTPNGSGSLRLENVDGPPGAIAYSAITLDILHPGLPAAVTFPNGWFYGVPIGFTELLTQLTLPPPQPFLSLLSPTGYSLNVDLPGGFVSAFIGANLWSVGVAFDPATGFTSVADTTAPTAYTIN